MILNVFQCILIHWLRVTKIYRFNLCESDTECEAW